MNSYFIVSLSIKYIEIGFYFRRDLISSLTKLKLSFPFAAAAFGLAGPFPINEKALFPMKNNRIKSR